MTTITLWKIFNFFPFAYDSTCDKGEILPTYGFKNCYQQCIQFISVTNEHNAELSTVFIALL